MPLYRILTANVLNLVKKYEYVWSCSLHAADSKWNIEYGSGNKNYADYV